jgi:hypothetical protein
VQACRNARRPERSRNQEGARSGALQGAPQATAVYQEHNPSGIETKVWISKSTHLPLKSESTNNAGGPAMTSFTVSTFDCNNVRALWRDHDAADDEGAAPLNKT